MQLHFAGLGALLVLSLPGCCFGRGRGHRSSESLPSALAAPAAARDSASVTMAAVHTGTASSAGPSGASTASTGTCRVQTASSAWSEFGPRNAYTADGAVHKFSVCSGNQGPWAWQSSGNITVKECAAQAKKLQAKCWDFLCPYKFAENCTCPASTTAPPLVPAPSATKVACVGDSITAGYLSSCGLNYPNQLQALLGKQYAVTNYGVGGKTMLKQAHLPAGDHASYWNTRQYAAALNSTSDIVVLMLGTNDAKCERWAMSSAVFSSDYHSMAQSFLALTPKPKLYVMVPPPLYRDGRYNMNQTV